MQQEVMLQFLSARRAMLDEIEELLDRSRRLEQEVAALEQTITAHQDNYPEWHRKLPKAKLNFARAELKAIATKANSSKATLSVFPTKPRQKRVRGVLDLAKKVIQEMDQDQQFDKDQLLEKLTASGEFSKKDISVRSIRTTIRTLKRLGLIREERKPTLSTNGTYIKAA
jgi:hypothetical protein